MIFHSYVSLPEGNLEHDQPHQLSRVRLFIFSPFSQVLLIQMSWRFLFTNSPATLSERAKDLSGLSNLFKVPHTHHLEPSGGFFGAP